VTTPGQTIGPFFHGALPYPGGGDLVPPGSPGAIRLHGHVYDGAGEPVPDAMLEIGQAGPDGRPVRAPGSLRRDGWTFTGWGRAETDATGHYSFSTLIPGPAEPGGAAFFAVTVFARGLTNRLFTRAYLPDPPPDDPFLAGLAPERRATLVATPDHHGLVFDVRLQGDRETVFLRFPRHE
jgi:protocatechuate 3,4-dioxygenase, alpha subunit